MLLTGNNGGDYLNIELIEDGVIRLEVGSECCVSISQNVPVEFITAALTKIIDIYGSPENFIV